MALDAQVLQQGDVFLIEMVGIVGNVAGVALEGFSGGMGKDIPVGLAASVFVDGAFDLVGGRSASPEESFRKVEGFGRLGEGEAREGGSGKSCGGGSGYGFSELAAGQVFHGGGIVSPGEGRGKGSCNPLEMQSFRERPSKNALLAIYQLWSII